MREQPEESETNGTSQRRKDIADMAEEREEFAWVRSPGQGIDIYIHQESVILRIATGIPDPRFDPLGFQLSPGYARQIARDLIRAAEALEETGSSPESSPW